MSWRKHFRPRDLHALWIGAVVLALLIWFEIVWIGGLVVMMLGGAVLFGRWLYSIWNPKAGD